MKKLAVLALVILNSAIAMARSAETTIGQPFEGMPVSCVLKDSQGFHKAEVSKGMEIWQTYYDANRRYYMRTLSSMDTGSATTVYNNELKMELNVTRLPTAVAPGTEFVLSLKLTELASGKSFSYPEVKIVKYMSDDYYPEWQTEDLKDLKIFCYQYGYGMSGS